MVPWVGLQYVISVFPDKTHFFVLNWAEVFRMLNDEVYHVVTRITMYRLGQILCICTDKIKRASGSLSALKSCFQLKCITCYVLS